MEVIKANPESIIEIFQKLYVIPEYIKDHTLGMKINVMNYGAI